MFCLFERFKWAKVFVVAQLHDSNGQKWLYVVQLHG